MEQKEDPKNKNLPAQQLEKEFVHNVYDSIAPHFSSTRYKVCNVYEVYRYERKIYSFL
jgi:hypothetical protein